MNESTNDAAEATPSPAPGWQKPTVEIISLDCEISSYAPDEDDRPLF